MTIPAADYLEKNCGGMELNDIISKTQRICNLLDENNFILKKINLLKRVLQVTGELIFAEFSEISDTEDIRKPFVFNNKSSMGRYRSEWIDDSDRKGFFKTVCAYETLEKCIDDYCRELEINPAKKYLFADLGLLYFEKNEPEKAVEMFEKYLNCLPKTLTLLKKVGQLYVNHGLLDEALHKLDNALTLSLNSREIQMFSQMSSINQDNSMRYKAELMFAIADIYLKKKESENAEIYLKKIISTIKDERYVTRARQKLIELDKNRPDYASILEDMREDLKKNNYNQDKRKKLIIFYAEQKMYDKAFDEISRMSDIGGETTPAVNEILGDVYFNKQEYDTALRYYNLALMAKPVVILPSGKFSYQSFNPFTVLQKMKKCQEFTEDYQIIIDAYKYYLQKNSSDSQLEESRIINIIKEIGELLKKQKKY